MSLNYSLADFEVTVQIRCTQCASVRINHTDAFSFENANILLRFHVPSTRKR